MTRGGATTLETTILLLVIVLLIALAVNAVAVWRNPSGPSLFSPGAATDSPQPRIVDP